jgi:uncharacterized protein (DUF1810 family)
MTAVAADEFDLGRFVEAQQEAYATALAELRAGRKRSHWIWFVFPQLRGLGRSAMSHLYGLRGLAEARAYAQHPVLGPRLVECVEAMLAHEGVAARAVLGEIDALKLRSCLTLFARAAPAEAVFRAALERYYGGAPDPATVSMLEGAGEP